MICLLPYKEADDVSEAVKDILRVLSSLSTEKLCGRGLGTRVIVPEFAVVGSGSKITEHSRLCK